MMVDMDKETMVSKPYAIWWLNQFDCEMIFAVAGGEDAPTYAPEYIQAEFRSRMGREGRGRLWTPPDIDVKEIHVDHSLPIWHQITGNTHTYGGIVMHMEDVPSVLHLPGIFTDLRMNVLMLPDVLGYIF